MCRIMIGDSAAAKLGAVPLSNDIVARRIEDMSNDIREQLIEFVKRVLTTRCSLDESTDIAGQAQLLTYVRYLRDKAIEEDVLFCRPLQSHTTGEAIFNVLDIFIRENGLAWDRCVGLCTDGAQGNDGAWVWPSCSRSASSSTVKWTHCMVNREALAAKKNAGSFWLRAEPIRENDKSHQIMAAKLSLVWGPLPGDGVRARTAASAHWSSLALQGAGVTAVVWAVRGGEVVFDRNQIRSGEASGWHYVACISVLFGPIYLTAWTASTCLRRPRNSYFAPCRQSARLHTKTRPLAWPHSRGNCDMFPSLADFITDAGTSHDFSSLFHQRLSTCQQWKNNLRRTLKRIIALLRGFEIRLCAQQTSYQLICRNSLLSWRVTVDWRNSLAPPLFRHSGQHWCRNILNSVTSLEDSPSFRVDIFVWGRILKMTALKTKYRNRAQIEDDLRLCLSNIEPIIEDLARQSRLRSHINITYLQASVKKYKWCLLLGLVIITIIKHKLISEVWCQFPIIAIA